MKSNGDPNGIVYDPRAIAISRPISRERTFATFPMIKFALYSPPPLPSRLFGKSRVIGENTGDLGETLEICARNNSYRLEIL